jgi:hypothetical protein
VPITPFVEGKVFDPDSVAAMSAVFVEVCRRLALNDKSDPATLLVAEKIIELASTGNYNQQSLRTAALRAFAIK